MSARNHAGTEGPAPSLVLGLAVMAGAGVGFIMSSERGSARHVWQRVATGAAIFTATRGVSLLAR